MALKDVGVKLVVEGSSQFKSAMGGAERSVAGVGGAIKKAAPTMRKFGIGLIGIAGAVGGASIKMAADFESGMREVSSLIDLSEDQFKDLSDQVLDLSKDLGVDAVEATKALYQTISAGIPAENALEFLTVASKAAIGGVTDTETAVDGLTTVINAFGLDIKDADKVADVMFQTVKRGKTTFDELSRSMFQVAPIAAASGVAFDEVSAALATMTKQGVPTSVATTQLRQAIVAIQKPTKEMQAVIEELGFATGQTMLDELGFAETLKALRNATEGNNEELFKMFGSIEAGQAVLALTGENAQGFAEDLKAIMEATDGAGASTEAFNEINKSTSRQFEMLQAKMKAVAIEIGTALIPAVLKIVEAIKPVLDKVINWISENPKLTATIVGIVGALGGLLLIIGTVGPAIAALGPVIALLTGPIGLVILAVVAIGLAIKAFADNWEVIWRGIKRITDRIINGIIDIINKVIRTINLLPGVNIAQIGKVGTVETSGVSERLKRIQEERGAEIAAFETNRLAGSTVNQTTINVEANYTDPQEPQSIELDLEAVRMVTES